MTMPGLGKSPGGAKIDIDDDGNLAGAAFIALTGDAGGRVLLTGEQLPQKLENLDPRVRGQRRTEVMQNGDNSPSSAPICRRRWFGRVPRSVTGSGDDYAVPV